MTEGSVDHLEADLFRTLGQPERAQVLEPLAAGERTAQARSASTGQEMVS